MKKLFTVTYKDGEEIFTTTTDKAGLSNLLIGIDACDGEVIEIKEEA